MSPPRGHRTIGRAYGAAVVHLPGGATEVVPTSDDWSGHDQEQEVYHQAVLARIWDDAAEDMPLLLSESTPWPKRLAVAYPLARVDRRAAPLSMLVVYLMRLILWRATCRARACLGVFCVWR